METAKREFPIVAVFGSTNEDALELAKLIGAAIVRHGGVLLTGGIGKKKAAVKEKAIAGARAARGKDCIGAWIGVDPKAQKKKPGFVPKDKSCVIQTGFGNKRNYLEACLCDAAIALKDGKGTLSEVTFCLSLRKPVVLIGDWESEYPLAESETLCKLVEASFKRVKENPSGDATLDKLLAKGAILTNLKESLPAYRYYPMPAENDRPNAAKDAVDQIFIFLQPFQKIGFKGTFPELDGAEYKKVKTAYDSWLRQIENKLIASA
jgi:uncharacterized protein (TIGR00725 family)